MKKLLLSLLTITILFGCSSNEEGITSKVFLNFKLATIPDAYKSKYDYSDFNIKIYKTRENYLEEMNPIYTGKFNTSGELSANGNDILDGHAYYVDIFTNDKVITNWTLNGINNYMPAHNQKFESEINLSDDFIYVGEWVFVDYLGHFHQTNLDRTTRTKLIINKGFEIKSYENYNNKDLIVNYRFKSNGSWVKFLNMSIPEADYPFCNNNLKSPDAISLQYDKQTKLLRFDDYANEDISYSKK